VLTSYCIEAVLVTAAFVVFKLHHYGWWMKKQKAMPDSPWNKTFNVFQGSLNELFLGIIVICLAIQLASIVLMATNNQSLPVLAYALNGVVAQFAFFPILVIAPTVRIFPRRPWVRRTVLAILYLVTVIGFVPLSEAGVYYLDLRLNGNDGEIGSTIKEQYTNFQVEWCPDPIIKGGAGVTFASGFMFVAAILTPPCYYLSQGLILGMEKMFKWNRRRWSRFNRALAMYVMELEGLLGMWFSLAVLIYTAIGLTSGPDWVESQFNKWTFGQILAAATWLPVMLDMGHIAICKSPPLGDELVSLSRQKEETNVGLPQTDGMKTSWDTKLPGRLRVVAVTEAEGLPDEKQGTRARDEEAAQADETSGLREGAEDWVR